jgi:hypothetical protein
VIDVQFAKQEDKQKNYDEKVNKYKRSYGEDCVIPIICGYDGMLFS